MVDILGLILEILLIVAFFQMGMNIKEIRNSLNKILEEMQKKEKEQEVIERKIKDTYDFRGR